MSDSPELVLDSKSVLGEGAIWHAAARLLYWIDIEPGLVHVYDPKTKANRTLKMGQQVGTIVPRTSGGAMVALKDGFAALDLGLGKLELWSDPEAHLTSNRFNDGKCDPSGRFWAGTIGKDPGGLYRLDKDRSVHKMFGGVKVSNGIAWSRDRKTMYYIDTPTMEVAAWDYDDATGNISNRRVAITVPKENAYPDGSTLDADGNLWVAHWDGWSVTCYDPNTGKQIRKIPMPVQRVTSVAFGDDDLGTMYITSASIGLKPDELGKQPHAGGLFRFRPGVKGLPAPEYAG